MPLNFPTTEDELITYKQSIDNLDSVEFLEEFNVMDIYKYKVAGDLIMNPKNLVTLHRYLAAIILAIKKIGQASEPFQTNQKITTESTGKITRNRGKTYNK